MERVTVAIPAYGAQDQKWWGPLWRHCLEWERQGIHIDPVPAYAAMPDQIKNMHLQHFLRMNGKNDTITSENRNRLAEAHRELGNDWLFFIDHDTVPPLDSLPRLLSMERPFVAGVYHHRNDPSAPLMYRKVPENGLYKHITDYEKGALVEVDAVGMGCTLIHREVFEAIKANYVQFMRPNGSRFLVHRDDMHGEALPSRYRHHDGERVYGDERGYYYVQPIAPTPPKFEEDRPFPFYDMEQGRTEDLVFCERAARVGYKCIVDTLIVNEHLHYLPITDEKFFALRDQMKVTGILPSAISKDGLYD